MRITIQALVEGSEGEAPRTETIGVVERDGDFAPACGLGLFLRESQFLGRAAVCRPMHTAASMTADPARIEAALIMALQSPAVEEALVELFARTMAKALLRVGAGDSRPAAHADDEVDAGLKDMDVCVIRHAGNAWLESVVTLKRCFCLQCSPIWWSKAPDAVASGLEALSA